MAQPGKREHKRAVDTLRRRSEQGMATILEHAVSEDGHMALLKNSCVSTHMREFSVIAKTDEPARDAERKQVSVWVCVCLRVAVYMALIRHTGWCSCAQSDRRLRFHIQCVRRDWHQSPQRPHWTLSGSHSACFSDYRLLTMLQASINRINARSRTGYIDASNLEVSKCWLRTCAFSDPFFRSAPPLATILPATLSENLNPT